MKADWIAVDWGTSNLRAWAMGPEGVLAEGGSDKGMGRLARDQFERALLDVISPWLGTGETPVLACGMVGARQGWFEASYRAVPCPPVEPGDLPAVATPQPADADEQTQIIAIELHALPEGAVLAKVTLDPALIPVHKIFEFILVPVDGQWRIDRVINEIDFSIP